MFKYQDDEHICAKCGAPLETEPSEYKWDKLCNTCFGKFKDWTLDLALREDEENLSEYQFSCELRKIAWEFHIDPESVRAYIWTFS